VEVYKLTKYTPWINGKAKRAGKEILDKARTLVIDNKIPKYLWPFVEESVVRILNLLPLIANKRNVSPYEIFAKSIGIPETLVKLYIRYLRTYFYDVYYYVKLQDRIKLDK
jgi:hypothetical protein